MSTLLNIYCVIVINLIMMKSIFAFAFLTMLLFSCEKNDVFRSETDERFSILKEEIESMPKVPINFYWEPTIWDSAKIPPPVTSCLTTEVRFEYPYVIANGIKFHVYYWSRTQNKLVGPDLTVQSMLMAFNQEK